ncbi:MAG: diacylglycerol kinase family protein, partial [Verrucomicrobiae bacterium]|nr:diacylglycerol kinase family protein [Verrucomicrobiae bacterium]
MRACVIFNPTARGERARQFRRELTSLAGDWALKPTAGPGHAIYLAREAVSEGFDTIVAAGGDGTVSEVVHGIATAESGLERVRLGVVPLGTMNVLARELGFPQDLHAAWNILRNAREVQIDLPCVEFGSGNDHQRRYFAQLAGAGLDACAIAAVNWDWKKRIGPLAYLVAGFQAFMAGRPTVHARCGSEPATGELLSLIHI